MMRKNEQRFGQKLIRTFFAAALSLTMVPATALAEVGDAQDVTQPSEATENINTEIVPAESAAYENNLDNIAGSDDAISIPAATERVNETMALQTRTVAQAESTRSYFLAQTLESTRTVPIVSANLPLDTTGIGEADVSAEGEAPASEDEGGEDSDESDPAPGIIAAESTVVGSFTYLGMTFAVEPGGESVALVAVDYSKLPEAFIEKQIIVIPDVVAADGMNNYSVTRIADNAFASLTKENANEDYKGCEALFTDEELLAEAGIDVAEVEAFLYPESDTVDIDGDGETDGPANPLKDCTGILALGIPASVTNIGDEAFAGFDTLQYLVVSEDNPNYATFDGVLYDADLADIRLIPEGRVGAVRVAPSATDVDPEVFSHCPSVTTLVADPESGKNQQIENQDKTLIPMFEISKNLFDVILGTVSPTSSNAAYIMLNERIANGALSYTVYPNGGTISRSGAAAVSGPIGETVYSGTWRLNGTILILFANNGSPLEIQYVAQSRTGYRFVGWSKTGNVINAMTSGDFTLTAGDAWYACWAALDRVIIDPNGGSISRNDQASTQNAIHEVINSGTWKLNGTRLILFMNNGSSGEIIYTIQQRPGYRFVGWSKTGSTTDAATSGMYSVAPGDRWYACWTEFSGIIIDPNGGSLSRSGAAPQSFPVYEVVISGTWRLNGTILILFANNGSPIELQYKVSDRPGYRFKGWSKTGQVADARTSGDFTMAQGDIWYACWEIKTYTVTLDAKGGTGGTASVPITYGSAMPEATMPTKEGYTFAGYYDIDSDTEGTQYYTAGGQSNHAWDKDQNAILYARWTPNSIAITWNSSEGAWGEETSKTENQTCGKTLVQYAQPSRMGYIFDGWCDSAGNALTSSTKVPSKATTYFAHWKGISYTVLYEGNSETSGSMVASSHTYDEAKTLNSNGFVKTGYNFVGWTTEKDGSGTRYEDGESVTNLASANGATVTLYAQWSADDRELTLSANNGKNETIPGKVPVTWDAAVPALAGYTAASITAAYEPAPAGTHVFEGFYTEAVGGTQYYDENLQPIGTFNHDIDTLYAHWRDKRDIHNHVYCSSGVTGNFADGYAFGWTCPSYDTYVARVYVADSVTPSDTEGHVFGVPESEQGKISGKVSVDAVRAGEYVLLAGGYQKAGWLPTDKTGTDWETYKGAWWEITAKPGESTGTLRVHSDKAAKITFDAKSDGSGALKDLGANPAWRTKDILSKADAVLMDHVDATKTAAWFSNSSEFENRIRTVELVGNTWPPSCIGVSRTFFNLENAYSYSDNMTLLGLSLDPTKVQDALFHTNVTLASLPKDFKLVLPSTGSRSDDYSLRSCINLLSLPDSFRVDGIVKSSNSSLFDLNSNATIVGLVHGGVGGYTALKNTGRLGTDGYAGTYYAGTDSQTKTQITHTVGTIEGRSTYTFRKLNASTSVTWDAQGGSFSPDYTKLDCSRVYALTDSVKKPTGIGTADGFTNATTVVAPTRKNADGTVDPFLGWYKKVPMSGTFGETNMLTKESNGRTWAENRYLYDYSFVWDGRDDTNVTVPNTDESIVYYAMYESDADKIKSDIVLKMNDGTEDDGFGATVATIKGQVYGQPLKADSGIPGFTPYTFDGYWTEPVGGKQYYGADGKPVAGITWEEVGDTVTLYAHWRYRIVFDANPAGCATLIHQGEGMPTHAGTRAGDATYQSDSFGNRYSYASLASGAMDIVSVSAVRGVPVKLPFAVGRTGYTDGCRWSETSDASTGLLPVDASGFTVKAAGSDVRAMPSVTPDDTGTVTLFADWTDAAKTSDVTLSASAYDGFAYAGLTQAVTNESSRTRSVTATYDATMPTPEGEDSIVVPSMRGYSFLGYFSEPQEEAVTGTSDPETYAPSTMFYKADGKPTSALWATEGDATLYAHYRQIPYTLSFAAGTNVEGDTFSIGVFYGYDLGLADNRAVTKKGATFKGWNTKADGTGSYWFDAEGNGASGTLYLTEGDTVLYPVWEERTYTIVWHFDWSYEDDEGTSVSFDHESLMRDDEDFDGTLTVPGIAYGDAVDIPSPETIAFDFHGWYRQKWPALQHKVANDVDNGQWFSETDGTYSFEPADDAKCPDTVDFYASWDATPHPYTITLKTSGHGSSFAGESEITLDNTYSVTEDPNNIYAEANLPVATEAGWKFGGWIETTDGKNVPYTDEYVPRGTGNREFEATWVVSDAKYSVSFSKGPQVSGTAPYSPLDKVLMDDSAKKRYFDATGATDDEGALTLPELDLYETAGYVFEGWFRAKTGTDGAYEFVTPYEELAYADGETEFSGQEMVNRASAAGTENLIYMAKWIPKTFEVRYKATSDKASEMKASAYVPVKLTYEDTVTLEAPVFEQTGAKGRIFKYWEGTDRKPARDPKMVPGAAYTVRDLLKEAGTSCVSTRTEDGEIVNELWLTAEWDKALSFTVPLVVNIIVDPERPEGTKVGEAWIETESDEELFVESASLTRDADLATTLQAKGVDRSNDVFLTVLGDKAPSGTTAEPLKMNLGAGVANVHRDLAANGLGTLKASADGKPGRVNLTYDLALREDATPALSFRDFENLAAIKDVRKADNSHVTLPVGRVFYTLSLTRPAPATSA